jgi:hypothetical protein
LASFPRYLGIDPSEPDLRQIDLVNKDIDCAYRIIFANPVFQALRKQRALPTIRALNEALHPMLPRINSRESHNTEFSHSQSQNLLMPCSKSDAL